MSIPSGRAPQQPGSSVPAIQYWSSLKEAWEETENRPLASGDDAVQPAVKSENDWKLIKSESRVRLMLLEPLAPHSPLICKIYHIPWHLAWRTIGMVSRANREFTALMEAHQHGLPVVCPRYWLEKRLAGAVVYSAITLAVIDGHNLEYLLRNEQTSNEQRSHLARETGILLSQLHRGGLYWATARPRNVMQSAGGQLLAIDMPYAHWHGHDLTGSDSALIDLRGMLKCKNKDWGFNQQEHMEFLLGYCEDDQVMASALELLALPHSATQSKFERFKRRSANVLLSGPRSAGKGGSYDPSDGSYQLRDSQAITIY